MNLLFIVLHGANSEVLESEIMRISTGGDESTGSFPVIFAEP
jgi:hypothetical protein